MTLLSYEIFQTILEQGSFTKAAQILHLTPSAISHSISSMEEEIGFPLFIRSKNGVRLTILEQCRILKLSRATYYECCRFEAERQKKKTEENKIRLRRAKTVINEWSTHSTYSYKKMQGQHLCEANLAHTEIRMDFSSGLQV